MFKLHRSLFISTFIALMLFCAQRASAVISEFDIDNDAANGGGPFTPQSASPNTATPFNSYDGINDPNLDGTPPTEITYRDIRTGSAGLLEEVPSGFEGVTSSSGTHHGVMYPEGGDGGHGFPAAANSALGAWSYQVDIFTDPRNKTSQQTGANYGTPDFWWTNSIGPGYVTESGFSPEIEAAGGDLDFGPASYWNMKTTGGIHVANIPVGNWVTLETYFHESTVRPGKIAATHNVWSTDHTQLYGSVTVDTLFQDPSVSFYGSTGYTWFPFIESNVHHLTIDRLGIDIPITLVQDFILGDMDGDGDVDNFDIQPFELALTNRPLWESTYGLDDADERGDINGVGGLDNFDIQPFENLLTGGAALGAMAAVPEPSTLLLLGVGGVGLAIAARRRRNAA